MPQSDEIKSNLLNQIKSGLTKSRKSLSKNLYNIFKQNNIDEQKLEELEDILIQSDFGVQTTTDIIDELRRSMKNNPQNGEILKEMLRTQLSKIIQKNAQKLEMPNKNAEQPFVILVMGVNGSGKTTTIGKLSQFYKNHGYKIMVAAADTFRAAASEQLTIIAEQNDCLIYKQKQGYDPAALAYEAWQKAREKQIDILIVDTAGRLHNKQHLMDQLAKISRVLQKLDQNAPHKKILILDATTGQNILNQVEVFNQKIPLSGIILTKIDSTAKGGILIAICQKFDTKIYALGVGEKKQDLIKFEPKNFVNAIVE